MSEPLPARAALTLYRGDSRVWTVELTGYDFASGHTFLAQIRTDKDRAAPVVVDLTTALTGSSLKLSLSSAQADTLGVDGAGLWWDFQTTRTADGFRRTWLAGPVTVKGDVSNG